MKLASVCALVCGLLASHAVRADVTMRSKIDYKLGSYLPPAAAEGMNKAMGDSLANGVVLRIKGKRSLSSSGTLLIITDQDKGTITLLDPKGKRYATCPIAEYGDKLKAAMPAMPPEAKQMLESLKIDVKTDKTGKTDVVKGIRTEEMLVTVTMGMEGPMEAVMGMKMEMHMWAATKEELDRVPALKELASYAKAQAAGTDPASMASKMFGQLPGFGDKLKGPMEELMKASSNAVLRTQMKMMMPGSAKMMGATDPDEPFTDMTTDVAELSTDAIADSVFLVPEGYESAKLEDLVQLLNPARQQAPRQEPPAPPIPPAPAAPPQPMAAKLPLYRVGNGVTAPALLTKVAPQYPEEARQAGQQGAVLLYVQINPEGKAVNMRILHSLGLALDTNAMEAVKQWDFRPGTKDGKPVTVEAQIEVNFRLTSDGRPVAAR